VQLGRLQVVEHDLDDLGELQHTRGEQRCLHLEGLAAELDQGAGESLVVERGEEWPHLGAR
jgi:hypothetical protein